MVGHSEKHATEQAAGYSSREVAGLVGMSMRQIRAFVSDGLLEPGRGPRGELVFSFKDVALLRAAQGLSSQLPARRVRQALRLVREQCDDAELSAVQLRDQGGEIVVGDGRVSWRPESGQVLLDFERVDSTSAPVLRLADARSPDRMAASWFEMGLELEERGDGPTRIEEAYRRALATDPCHADACINLGRILHERGEAAEAAELYERAADLGTDDATAYFNLGVALEDLGRNAEAIAAYERAIRVDARCADAFYNAAVLYEQDGDKLSALRHLRRYRALTRA